jgi:hypothetical protein
MGWTFSSSWPDKASMIAHLVKPEERFRTLKHCCRGNVLWAVQEVQREGEWQKFIACYLLGTHGGQGWGYKDMEESMGPCETSCPLGYFDLVPCPGGYAADWRERCRKAQSKPEVGATYDMPHCTPNRVTITSIRPLRGRCPDGGLYRVKRSQMGEKIA